MMRVAWFIPSGVAPVESPMHIPILTALAEKLSREVDLTVFSFSNGKTPAAQCGNASVRYLPAAWNDPLWKRAATLWGSFAGEHKRRAFGILHGFWGLPCGFLAASFGRFVRRPAVATFLGGETAQVEEIRYGMMRSWKLRRGIEWTCRNAAVTHLLTSYQQAGLDSQGLRLPRQCVFPLGIDSERFRWIRKKPAPPYRFLHVANLTEVKDQRTLLSAFKMILDRAPARLRIVGPDFMDGLLHRFARELGIDKHVEFTGSVSHKSVTRHYRWAHVYLQSSLHEGQGISVLEAMASGVPVCGTRVGILDSLSDSYAATSACGDAEQLAANALALLQSRRFETTARRARRWIEDHDINTTVEAMLSLYAGLEAA